MKLLCSMLAALVLAAPVLAGELQDAAALGDLEKVRSLLQANPAALNARDGATTALHEAARAGHLAVIKFLVEQGAELNALNFSKLTPTKLAASYGRKDVADYLRQQGGLEKLVIATNTVAKPPPLFGSNTASLVKVTPPVNTPPVAKVTTPVTPTLPPERPPTARELIAVNFPIHDLARVGNLEQIKIVYSSAPDLVDATDEKGLTPLHVAAANQQFATAQLLIALRATVNAKSFTGQTPLHIAARQGDLAITGLLLTNRAQVNARDRLQNTPLFPALQSANNDLDSPFASTLRPPMNHAELAAQRQKLALHRLQLVRLLLEHRAEVNIRNQAGVTPLLEAVRVGQEPVVALLLQAGADANAPDATGLTPLHLAAGLGQAAIADLLIRQRAGVNTLDARGETPLANALRSGHTNTITLLRQAGATLGPARKLTPTEQSLVDFYQRMELTLQHGTASEKSRAMITLNPTPADLSKMFPRHGKIANGVVEELNKQIGEVFKKPFKDADQTREIWRIHPEPPGLEAQDWRERGWLAQDLPVFSLAVEKTSGTTRPGDYCFVNNHWVLVPPLSTIAASQAAEARAAGR